MRPDTSENEIEHCDYAVISLMEAELGKNFID